MVSAVGNAGKNLRRNFGLRKMYMDGNGVKQDYQAAYEWFSIANKWFLISICK